MKITDQSTKRVKVDFCSVKKGFVDRYIDNHFAISEKILLINLSVQKPDLEYLAPGRLVVVRNFNSGHHTSMTGDGYNADFHSSDDAKSVMIGLACKYMQEIKEADVVLFTCDAGMSRSRMAAHQLLGLNLDGVTFFGAVDKFDMPHTKTQPNDSENLKHPAKELGKAKL